MLGTTPSCSADRPLHATKIVAVATTEMMWAVALATTRLSIASTARGLALWSQMLRAPIGPWYLTAFSPEPNAPITASVIATETAAPADAPAGYTANETVPPDPAGEEAAGFASYRSSGGHATAQVVVTPD